MRFAPSRGGLAPGLCIHCHGSGYEPAPVFPISKNIPPVPERGRVNEQDEVESSMEDNYADWLEAGPYYIWERHQLNALLEEAERQCDGVDGDKYYKYCLDPSCAFCLNKNGDLYDDVTNLVNVRCFNLACLGYNGKKMCDR